MVTPVVAARRPNVASAPSKSPLIEWRIATRPASMRSRPTAMTRWIRVQESTLAITCATPKASSRGDRVQEIADGRPKRAPTIPAANPILRIQYRRTGAIRR
jgi:hypothetical protein